MTVVRLDTPATRVGRYLHALHVAKGDPMGAAAWAAAQGWKATATLIEKGAVAALGDTDTDLRQHANDVAEVLRTIGVFGRIPGKRRIAEFGRVIDPTSGLSGNWIAESAPIPVGSMSFGAASTLNPKKVAALGVVSADLFRFAADDVIAREALAALARAIDEALLDRMNGGTDAKPASVTHDATVFTPDSLSGADVEAAFVAAISGVVQADTDPANVVVAMDPRCAVWLGSLRTSGTPHFPRVNGRTGGDIAGFPVLLTSASASSGSPSEYQAAVIDGAQMRYAEGDTEVDLSDKVALQLDDAPATGAQQLVSLWQHGLTGVRGTAWRTWEMRRSSAVAVVDNLG